MADTPPTSYHELADLLGALPLLVREARRRNQLSLRAAGRAAGVSFSTIARVERGEDAALSTVVSLLRWIGREEASRG